MNNKSDVVAAILDQNLDQDEVKYISPLVPLIIMEVLKILLEKCGERISLSVVNRPGLFERWLLKRYISQANDRIMKNGGDEPYVGSVENIYDWLRNYGSTLNHKTLRDVVYAVASDD